MHGHAESLSRPDPGKTNLPFPFLVLFSELRVFSGQPSFLFMKTPLILLILLALSPIAPLRAEPLESPAVTFKDFALRGKLSPDRASFTLSGTAVVKESGATLRLLEGNVALTELETNPRWRLNAASNQFAITFERRGSFPITLHFAAAVKRSNDWSSVAFQVAPATLMPIALEDLPAETEFHFAGAAQPKPNGAAFESFLPADGQVNLAWKPSKPETEGKLFYAAEMWSQVTVSPGLLRQTALLDFRVMQGEIQTLALQLRHPGEITRVQGEPVLAWRVETQPGESERRLIVQLNQPQKASFQLQIQAQQSLGVFPQEAQMIEIQPEAATRFGGFVRVVNDGAVRLEVAQTRGMSQISPEQFPESDLTRATLPLTGKQRFAYRFSGGDASLRIQADQVLPEISVSQVLAYHQGENERVIDAELELDVREAPMRELRLIVPGQFVVARLNASGMSDYFVQESADTNTAELRLVYGQPALGRQLVQLRLERNQTAPGTNWILPRVEVVKAKSVRGFVGIASDPGLRINTGRTEGLTEIATAFFPKKLGGLQSAFRISDPIWRAELGIERLPQTVQADVFHLFSIGEGAAYGSSLMNYTVSGAPITTFHVDLPDEYRNVEFTGKDIRNWQKTEGGYLVQLHTAVAGNFTLLATYERPFTPQGDTLAFSGARPRDAQTEQGHTVVVSSYQFQVTPTEVSAGLLPLEPGEVPAEYRLFFDAPILAAYRYSAQPFRLALTLKPLEQGDSLNQVVDRAVIETRISKEGQALTTARYFLKNRGKPDFRITLPPDTKLWSATVNGTLAVPVIDGSDHLIPLPANAAPDTPLELELKLAARSSNASRLSIKTPALAAPVLLAEWKLAPDEQQRLEFLKGTFPPVNRQTDVSGFAGLIRLFSGRGAGQAAILLLMGVALVGAGMVAWRWAAQRNVSRYSARHLSGGFLGLVALALAFLAFKQLSTGAQAQHAALATDILIRAPVQQAGNSLAAEVANVPNQWTWMRSVHAAWPALAALAAWLCAFRIERGAIRSACNIAGWTLLLWAALRWPNGAPVFLWILGLFLLIHVVLPALGWLWRVPQRLETQAPSSGTPALTAWLIAGLGFWSVSTSSRAAPSAGSETLPATAQSVHHEIRVENQFAFGVAHLRWQAEKGDTLPLLQEPAVLTSIRYPDRSLTLLRARNGTQDSQRLVAQRAGLFDIDLQYQLPLRSVAGDNQFTVPLRPGIVTQLKLAILGADVEVSSPQAVSVERTTVGTNTEATLVLSPANCTQVSWSPRSRDARREKSVFYADLSQVLVPGPGVIEGAHRVAIRPAQGELSELEFTVPPGATITEVLDDAAVRSPRAIGIERGTPGLVAWWRFDPDARQLRVALGTAQSRPFVLLIRSQFPAGALPFQQQAGLLTVRNAAGQIGTLGIATGSEVQLDAAEPVDSSVVVAASDNARAGTTAPTVPGALTAMNLEDFSAIALAPFGEQVPRLTVRRAFRYSEPGGAILLKASAVKPDVRVETQETLSLGEDRALLAVSASVEITRAGIFRISFSLPEGFDVESISGSALSHWTESKSDTERLVTLHLQGKTEGKQQFAITLAGAGIRRAGTWLVPQIVFREAEKQRGTLLVVPDQGMRLSVAERESVTQLDPEKSGIREKGVLAFRILQAPARLSLDIEQVDPWIQVTSLQHVDVSEARMKIAGSLQYQIENAGLKSLQVRLPSDAEGVRFQGDQLADFISSDTVTNGLKTWEIKLHRRIIGSYLLRVSYQVPLAQNAPDTTVRGVEPVEANVRRGFVTIESAPRLQVSANSIPSTLQPVEWQAIPRSLQQDLPSSAASLAYRLAGAGFTLPLQVERHDAARLLPARVEQVALESVVSANGTVLTRVRLVLLPGDKRLLQFKLPPEARFWFAFVNQSGVWPWREEDRILIPLDPASRKDQPVPVEIFYSRQSSGLPRNSLQADRGTLEAALRAPQFDLPLENITWRISMDDRWKLRDWSGSLQFQEEALVAPAGDLSMYLQTEAARQQERNLEAENLLNSANTALEAGDPQQARRKFQAAYGLSTHDTAFNEDARVQLHNLKLQQALVGLALHQANSTSGSGGRAGGVALNAPGDSQFNYTQQQAKDLIDRTTAGNDGAFLQVAERLVQQQDAAIASASALTASVPVQGRTLTFTRAVLVDPWADMNVSLTATARQGIPVTAKLLVLAGLFLVLGLAVWITRKLAQQA